MELLSVTMNDGVMPRSEIEGKDNSSEDKSNYKVVLTGDMVYNSMRMWQGANGISPCNGIVSPAYTVLMPKIPISNGYFAAFFKSPNLINEFRKNSQGMTSDTWNLKYPQIETIKVCIPALSEQNRVADMLRTLERRIAKQAQLVDNLKKYKRGVMQRIFRQLPSQNGTEWTCVRLGDIFKKVSRRNTDGVINNVITNSAEYGLIPQRDFFDKDIAVDGNTANYYVIENGNFVYNPRKSNSAPYGPFNRYTLSEQGIISPLYTCLVLQADISPSYLAWYFKSDAWYRYIYDNGSQGVRHDRVSMTDDLLMGIPVMYPSHVKQLLYADILDMVEARLQATQKTLDLLSKTRDGYMRQLFI
ncbi:restriction endonuclease subunit S [Pseudoflavonifractor sp. MCC625]|uniref:restriction endonuclease subunit S n=1 Tax=Pseudoflavonifractor sp. MCC625 TaxID=2592647 RepID=UPI002078ABF4|nr:restriction endonuclease subunit S [Pseudoflavonifractor sp. MCC625]MBT9685532.1 restriction endonuclease subunit S [Pseudoflavonifractor sp. MCC625]